MRHRSNPLDYDDDVRLDDVIRAFPYDAEARRELVAFRAAQDPEATLDGNIEWLMFSAFDGGVVDAEWADAACAAGFPEGYEREQRAVIGHYGQSIPYDTVGALERLWIAAATSLTS